MDIAGARPEYVEFIFVPSFIRSAEDLLSEDDIRELEQVLVRNPRAGVVIRGGGGVRKLRTATEGRGKSGSARVIYLYVELRGRIYLLLSYPKNAQADLTPEQSRRIRQLVAKLHAER